MFYVNKFVDFLSNKKRKNQVNNVSPNRVKTFKTDNNNMDKNDLDIDDTGNDTSNISNGVNNSNKIRDDNFMRFWTELRNKSFNKDNNDDNDDNDDEQGEDYSDFSDDDDIKYEKLETKDYVYLNSLFKTDNNLKSYEQVLSLSNAISQMEMDSDLSYENMIRDRTNGIMMRTCTLERFRIIYVFINYSDHTNKKTWFFKYDKNDTNWSSSNDTDTSLSLVRFLKNQRSKIESSNHAYNNYDSNMIHKKLECLHNMFNQLESWIYNDEKKAENETKYHIVAFKKLLSLYSQKPHQRLIDWASALFVEELDINSSSSSSSSISSFKCFNNHKFALSSCSSGHFSTSELKERHIRKDEIVSVGNMSEILFLQAPNHEQSNILEKLKVEKSKQTNSNNITLDSNKNIPLRFIGCSLLMALNFDCLYKYYDSVYVELENAAKLPGCICYVRAAEAVNYKPYFEYQDKYGDFTHSICDQLKFSYGNRALFMLFISPLLYHLFPNPEDQRTIIKKWYHDVSRPKILKGMT